MAHRVELAPSGRASCRGCKQSIEKGIPRFAEEYASPYSEDGAMAFRYWHLHCAAPKLANELAAALGAYQGPIEDRAALEALVAAHVRPPMPYAEHAGTGRARCRACDESIAKGGLRVAFERTFDSPMGPQKAAAFAHPRCLTRYLAHEKERGRESPELTLLLRQLKANSRLSAEELEQVEREATEGV
jgi:hypothetical protein